MILSPEVLLIMLGNKIIRYHCFFTIMLGTIDIIGGLFLCLLLRSKNIFGMSAVALGLVMIVFLPAITIK